MPKLAPVSGRALVSRMRALGFEGPYAGGRHPQMRRGEITVIIPNPHEGDIGVGLLHRLLRQAGVSRDSCFLGPYLSDPEFTTAKPKFAFSVLND